MVSGVIAASDLAGQFWCEMQVDLKRKHGAMERKEMRRGKEIHKDLLLEVTDVIPVSPRTPVDKLHAITSYILAGMKLFKETGIVREFPVFFRFESVFISGVLDEIQMVKVEGRDSKNRRRILTKTRVYSPAKLNPRWDEFFVSVYLPQSSY
ncbi:MAG: exonuclease V, partial [Candidatus Syntrophoarchaeum sp.]|nr:exonuclease V [Candidatus Syntrophoarchaeum sp.]